MGRSEELQLLLNDDLEILKTVHNVVLYRNKEGSPIAILFRYSYEGKGHIMFNECKPEVEKLYEIFSEVFLPITERTLSGKTVIVIGGQEIAIDPN